MPEISDFWNHTAKFTVVDGLILKGEKTTVPPDQMSEVLDSIHTGHLGMWKWLDKVSFGLGGVKMSPILSHLGLCQQHRISNVKEPMIPSVNPEFP